MAAPRKPKKAAPRKRSAITQRAVESSLTKLQDEGIIDLDAPLRDAIPALARHMVRYRYAQAARWWIVAQGDNPHAVCECEF